MGTKSLLSKAIELAGLNIGFKLAVQGLSVKRGIPGTERGQLSFSICCLIALTMLMRHLTGKESSLARIKRSGVCVHDPFGLPRGRRVDSIPNRFAIRFTHASSPKGRPRCTLTRSASNSDAD